MSVDYRAFLRQTDIINMQSLTELSVLIVGTGAIGSFTALALSKMGVREFILFDGDVIDIHNLSAQFFPNTTLNQNKAIATAEQLKSYAANTNLTVFPIPQHFTENDKINTDIVIATTDTIESRKTVFENATKSRVTKLYIDARMDRERLEVHTVNMKNRKEKEECYSNFLEGVKTKTGSCTARTIIYNVLLASSLIADSIKRYVNNQPIPKLTCYSFDSHQIVVGW